MSDPLGLVSNNSAQGIPSTGVKGPGSPANGRSTVGGADFKTDLMNQIAEVDRLQQNAEQVKIDAVTGEASLDQVIVATETADTAFRMLLAVRNKLVDAYDEVKNVRV
ncbi:MAG: flagellar hook-basal body complex protein FliE [Planctomycetaceae bacterium]|nr:flagellar hook-basal body complex protein FliE [Planctomycetaceae bacterium]